MPGNSLKDYWNPSFELLYDAWFYELASEYIIEMWYWIDLVITILTAVSVLAATISGWGLWAVPNGKIVWGCLSSTAFGLVILHALLSVPLRIRKEGERRQQFFTLRVELRSFRASLPLGSDESSANKRLAVFRKRLLECISKTPPDIVFTLAARRNVQATLNKKLEKFTNA